MGKLNIAHHKSYHPYRRDNIERVRKDEEEARLDELKKEGKMLMADSEARMDVLRQRSGGKSRKRKGSRSPSPPPATFKVPDLPLITPSGHVDLFGNAEASSSTSHSAAALQKKIQEKEAERGFALAPDKKDLRPWYTKRSSEKDEEPVMTAEDVDSAESARRYREQGRKSREAQRKTLQDPLKDVHTYLRKRSMSKPHEPSLLPPRRDSRPSPTIPKDADPLVAARLAREAAERERAEALIRRKQRERDASDASSSVGGDTPMHRRGYGDVYNRGAMMEAEASRNRSWGHSSGRR